MYFFGTIVWVFVYLFLIYTPFNMISYTIICLLLIFLHVETCFYVKVYKGGLLSLSLTNGICNFCFCLLNALLTDSILYSYCALVQIIVILIFFDSVVVLVVSYEYYYDYYNYYNYDSMMNDSWL